MGLQRDFNDEMGIVIALGEVTTNEGTDVSTFTTYPPHTVDKSILEVLARHLGRLPLEVIELLKENIILSQKGRGGK